MCKDKSVVILVGAIAIFIAIIGLIFGSFLGMTAKADSTIGFETLSGGVWDSVWVVYDRETGVMYAMSNGANNIGIITLMVNPDGTPRVYEGFR